MREPTPQSTADEVFEYIADTWKNEQEPMNMLAESLRDCEGKKEANRKREALDLLMVLSLYW